MARGPKRPAPAYLLLGEDSYLRSLLREEIIGSSVPSESRGMAVSVFSLQDTSLDEVLGRAVMPPLFTPRQVLVVSAVEEAGDEQRARLAEYFDSPPEFTVLVFESEKLDRRTRVARLLFERCQVREAGPPDDTAVVSIALEWARRHGVRLDRDTAEELIFALGNDTGRLHRELEKLCVYVGGCRQITPSDLEAVVGQARRFRVFDLVDLLVERRRSELLVRVRRLLEAGESAIGIVGLLAWLYRQLLAARDLPANMPGWKAAQILKAPRARTEALLRQAQRFRPDELHGGFAALLEADVALKSSPPDATAVVETLVMRLTPSGEMGRRDRA